VGIRLSQALAALSLSACTACGPLPGASSTKVAQPTHGATSPKVATHEPSVAPASDAPSPRFVSAPRAVAQTARRFVLGVADYDSVHEGRRASLSDLRDVSTAREWERLARSARTHLPWRVLRARAERAHLRVTGLSLALPSGNSVMRVVVQGILTTRTDLAVVRSFQRFELTLTRQPRGWRVATAAGPGL
jgi:hypothetical protein